MLLMFMVGMAVKAIADMEVVVGVIIKHDGCNIHSIATTTMAPRLDGEEATGCRGFFMVVGCWCWGPGTTRRFALRQVAAGGVRVGKDLRKKKKEPNNWKSNHTVFFSVCCFV